MLQDYKPQLDTPKRQGRLALVYIQADIGSSGAVTISTDGSSPRTSITLNGAGRYDITYPKCTYAHLVGAYVINDDAVPATGEGQSCLGFNFVPGGAGSGRGTGSILVVSGNGAVKADPPNGSKLHITLLVGQP